MSDKELVVHSLTKLLNYLHQMENLYPVELEELYDVYLSDLAFSILKLRDIFQLE